jgi:hypothetical protein
MKEIFKYAFILAFTISSCGLMCGCDDFLNENPESTYTTESFYTSQKDFEYAITSVYAEQQDLYDGTYGLLRMNNTRSDDTDCNDFNTYSDGYATFTDNASVQATREIYSSLYVIIERTNFILIRIDDIEFTDSNLKNYIKGEAHALRGWAYHTLGVLFGGIPLIVDAEYTVNEIRQIKRSTQEETFSQAIADYRKAFDLLPEVWDSENIGRVTKYAAKALEGRLYMFQGNYSSAQTSLKDVIDSGIYSMPSDYEKSFHADNENQPNNDRIWEVQYIGGQLGEGQIFSESSLQEDYASPWNFARGSSAALNASKDFINNYEEGDLRKEFSVVNNYPIKGVVDDRYFFIKFNHSSYTPQQSDDWDVNLPIIRYTDVLMMYAEAVNQISGPTPEAVKIINDVRGRVGLGELTSAQIGTKDAFLTAIKHERRMEFAYEGLRWNDLIRWGDGVSVMNNFFQQPDQGNGMYNVEGNWRYIYAIPQEEIARYGNADIMWQNPGY